MRSIWTLFRGIWVTARIILVDIGEGITSGRGAGALYAFLFMIFLVIGLVLVLLGIDLDAVDRWLDARAGLFDRLGTIAFKALLAVILLVCAFILGAGVYDRIPGRRRPRRRTRGRATRAEGNPEAATETTQRFGIGMMIGAAIVAYFAYVGLVN